MAAVNPEIGVLVHEFQHRLDLITQREGWTYGTNAWDSMASKVGHGGP
jgi:hypothetical protein